MLRLNPVKVETPSTVDEVVSLLDKSGAKAKLCAGGTDVIPNMKHGLHEPEVLVHLTRVSELKGVREDGDDLVIGAMTTLEEASESDLVREFAPGLADAAHAVAGPQLRRMGTLGGNVCLDTRCLYYNQTYFWRESLGFCLKKDGTQCHVIAGGKKCVAAASNDTATMLLSLGASVVVKSTEGERTIALEDFYVANGAKNTVLEPGDLLVEIRVKKGGAHRREGYAKLRHRESIDFPMLSVAVRFDVDAHQKIERAEVTVSALAAKPRRIKTDWCVGEHLDAAFVQALGEKAFKQSNPLTNICDDPAWRKDMVPVYVERACFRAIER